MSETSSDAAAYSAERQAQDLASIHALFSSILEEILGEPIPELEKLLSLQTRTSLLRRSVAVMDLAISPLMLRDALRSPALKPAADALLRYFVRKCCLREADRDKTDFVVTYLYRTWNAASDNETMDCENAGAFETEIVEVLGTSAPPLSEEHQYLLREFELFRSETYGFRHFDDITDSGIVHRVRAMKQSFGAAFYHPSVLAAAATYNAFFRQCFDALFHKAATEIRKFAASMVREDADTFGRRIRKTVRRGLSEDEEAEILDREYGRAQEELREISGLRKVAGKQRPAPPRTSADNAPDWQEETKIRKLQEMICVYLQAAGNQPCFTVPLPFGSFRITEGELAAFRAGHIHEKSFRAEFAAVIMRVVALRGCMTAELVEYSANRCAAYRWKPHADSLSYLLKSSETSLRQSLDLFPRIEERGLSTKRAVLEQSLEALRLHMQEVARVLKEVY